jgi:hypothetical protein
MRKNESLTKLNRTFMNQGLSIQFSPPNITAFKKSELGVKGSLFQAQNEKINTAIEA